MKNLKNLFIGPTEAQMEKIQRQNVIETLYMQWIRENPNAQITEAQQKYNELNRKD